MIIELGRYHQHILRKGAYTVGWNENLNSKEVDLKCVHDATS